MQSFCDLRLLLLLKSVNFDALFAYMYKYLSARLHRYGRQKNGAKTSWSSFLTAQNSLLSIRCVMHIKH